MIYLDHHSTTPCDQRVVDAMLPWWTESFANPHSDHAAGREVTEQLENAIDQFAIDLGTQADRLLFTSGATESNNLAITGYCTHPRQKRRQVITARIEHPSAIDPIENLKRIGFEVAYVDVDEIGRLDLDMLENMISEATALVSVGWANHEIGTIQNTQRIGEIASSVGAAFHCDATQAVGRLSIHLTTCGADLVTGSAHKFYGPRGVGFLAVGPSGKRVRLNPMILGGGQQRALRSGTLNAPGILGMQAALRIASAEIPHEQSRLADLRQTFWTAIHQRVPEIKLNGPELDSDIRLSGNLNFAWPDVEGEAIMTAVEDVAFSTGSACSSVDPEPSQILTAIGRSESAARRSIRIGLGRGTTAEEIRIAADRLLNAYDRLTSESPKV